MTIFRSSFVAVGLLWLVACGKSESDRQMDAAKQTVRQMERDERLKGGSDLLNMQPLISENLSSQRSLNELIPRLGNPDPAALGGPEWARDQRIQDLEAKVKNLESQARTREAFER